MNQQNLVLKVFLREQQVFAKLLLSSKMVFSCFYGNRRCSLCSQAPLQQQPEEKRNFYLVHKYEILISISEANSKKTEEVEATTSMSKKLMISMIHHFINFENCKGKNSSNFSFFNY